MIEPSSSFSFSFDPLPQPTSASASSEPAVGEFESSGFEVVADEVAGDEIDCYSLLSEEMKVA